MPWISLEQKQYNQQSLNPSASWTGSGEISFDFFGQGESDGPFEELRQPDRASSPSRVRSRDRQRPRPNRTGRFKLWRAVAILTAAQRHDVACLALKCPVVDFAEELRLEFGPIELARWQAMDSIPNIMGRPDRIRLKYEFYEDSLEQIAYGPAEHITAPTLIVQGEQDECVPLHQSRRLYAILEG